MLPTMVLLVLLLGHIIFAYILYRQMLVRKVSINPILWIPILILPYLGPVAVTISYWLMSKQSRSQKIEIGQEDFLELEDQVLEAEVEDEDSVDFRASEDVRQWVPIEEALLLNDSITKRELMMSMLKDQPSNVVALLQEARMNEDVEVVHYATVMLAELHKDYDLKVHQLKEELAKQPDNLAILEELCLVLEDYLMSGLVAGKFAESSRHQYIDLLRRKVALSHELNDYIRLGKQYLALGEEQRVRQVLEYCQINWPTDESYRMFQFQALVAQGDRLGLQQFFQDIDTCRVYFSRHNRQVIHFWRQQV